MTDHEATAKQLLPCDFVVEHGAQECLPNDKGKCKPCLYRPAVAAALAETYDTAINAGVDACNDMQAEIAQLRAERDAAFVRGLERAREIVAGIAKTRTFVPPTIELVDAIAAEIEKAGK
jgi:hypothetical protein